MSLTSALEKAPPREQAPTVTLYFHGEPLRFREPHLADIAPSAEARRTIRAAHPFATEATVEGAYTLARCYIPDVGEQVANAAEAFGRIAASDEPAFVDLLEAFWSAYPRLREWLMSRVRQDDEGNA